MQTHHHPSALQHPEHPGLHHKPSAARHHRPLPRMPALDKRPLHRTKRRFPFLRENLRDGFFLLPLNLVIAVDHVKAELVRHGPAHGALARAHESNEVEIDVRCVHHVTSDETHRPPPCQTPKSL